MGAEGRGVELRFCFTRESTGSPGVGFESVELVKLNVGRVENGEASPDMYSGFDTGFSPLATNSSDDTASIIKDEIDGDLQRLWVQFGPLHPGQSAVLRVDVKLACADTDYGFASGRLMGKLLSAFSVDNSGRRTKLDYLKNLPSVVAMNAVQRVTDCVPLPSVSPSPHLPFFESIDFAAAGPLTYDHQMGGGAYNGGAYGAKKDIVKQLNGDDFCCGDIVTFLTRVATVQVSRQTSRLQLRFAFELGVSGLNYEFDAAHLNVGQVVNGDGPGQSDSGFKPSSGASDSATVVKNTVIGSTLYLWVELGAAYGNVEDALQAGHNVVLRVDMRLTCASHRPSYSTDNLIAELESAYSIDSSGRLEKLEDSELDLPNRIRLTPAVKDCSPPPPPALPYFQSIDFAAAGPDTYDHKYGGGAYNDGTDGGNKDIVKKLDGASFCCEDRVSFLTRVTTTTQSSLGPTEWQGLQLRYVFDTQSGSRPGLGYSRVEVAKLNVGKVVNGDDYTGQNPRFGNTGYDSGFVSPQSRENGQVTVMVNETDSDELILWVELEPMVPGESVVLRIEVTLACYGERQGDLSARLRNALSLDRNGRKTELRDLQLPQTINLRKAEQVDTCHQPPPPNPSPSPVSQPLREYVSLGEETGCRGAYGSNTEGSNFIVVQANDLANCLTQCDDLAVDGSEDECYGVEFRSINSNNRGCQLWITAIDQHWAEQHVYGSTCYKLKTSAKPASAYEKLGENTACKGPGKTAEVNLDYMVMEAGGLAECQRHCDECDCFGVRYRPLSARLSERCEIWLLPIDRNQICPAPGGSACYLKVLGCQELVGCRACAARSDCSWQDGSCQIGRCPRTDVACSTHPQECPEPECVCERAKRCGQCTSSGCVWEAGQCQPECSFGHTNHVEIGLQQFQPQPMCATKPNHCIAVLT
eukprot:gb/GEZN01000724.1/.p1 GENE.gb/GEZN01000724.1/~~gb/GEZN01000724.1/.p1  ORF type:complete len:1038 (+),score=166.51 gb/GEZN01000724.1/:344-3115(+)